MANTFWLLLPILVFNVIFARYLPSAYKTDQFWKDIPGWISLAENILRIAVMILPLVMRFSISTLSQRVGLWLYLVGIVLYFASWWVQIAFPESAWSTSAAGFLAPAYTPVVWLAGIALIGDTLTISAMPYSSRIYLVLSGLFLIFHNLHAWLVYARNS
ncbi:hypothetical protein [Geotalea uraniireducens]|uniref:hypothetical protein n=1 Tax=Geotalea uraniireducens TaxID=351604 RepID=UPI0012ECDD8D|nr:hypothetical protein [Geotalea uraniireducens]